MIKNTKATKIFTTSILFIIILIIVRGTVVANNERNKTYEGKIVKCLVIGLSDKDDTKVCGYTENMKLVNVDAPKEDIGKIINVKITEAKSFSLDGIKES